MRQEQPEVDNGGMQENEEKTTERNDTEELPAMSAKHVIWELSKILIIALLIVLPIRLFVMQPFFVRGASMEPTFLDGDYLIIDELTYRFKEPQRGDVIVFRYPLEPSQFFIKRIVGLPHETVVITGEGDLRIFSDEFPNGAIFSESISGSGRLLEPQTVDLPEGEYYVLGDNRDASSDSRQWGTLGRRFIVGRAWLRLWPFNNIGGLIE